MDHIEFTLANKRTWLQGLIVDCPMGKPLENCPMKDLRNSPLKESLVQVRQLDEKQLDEIIYYHSSCLKERKKTQTQKCLF